jgi:hypothetical protein
MKETMFSSRIAVTINKPLIPLNPHSNEPLFVKTSTLQHTKNPTKTQTEKGVRSASYAEKTAVGQQNTVNKNGTGL